MTRFRCGGTSSQGSRLKTEVSQTAGRVLLAALALWAGALATEASAQERPPPAPAATPFTLRWGPQRPDLLRYNRVEGLSVGLRAQTLLHAAGRPMSLTATGRLGHADLEPNLRLDLVRETLDRRAAISIFHELAAVDERGRPLRVGNSLLAATVGRDDGDYYRRSGAWLEWTSPAFRRRSFRVRGFFERQGAARVETDFALVRLGREPWAFRANLLAEEGWESGALVEISPWWGTDPDAPQAGLDIAVQGALGDWAYVRTSALARLVLPLPADFRVNLQAGVGTSWGSPPVQRMWYLGGPSTLRGYDPRRLRGGSFGRGRMEVARYFSFGSVSVFGDVGWAGEPSSFGWIDALYSLGAGLSILDGLIRFDSAWGLKEPRTFRFEAYLDAFP